MADAKISALTSATTPLAGTEVVPLVQSSSTKKVSIANLTAGRAVTGSSFEATNFYTADTASGLTISSATVQADGTDANINIVVEPKGTGLVDVKDKLLVGKTLYNRLIMDATQTAYGGDGGVAIMPYNLPGSGVAQYYTYFKTAVAGAGSTVHNVAIDGALAIGSTFSGATQIDVDNLRLDGNTLSATNTNGNLTLSANGTGVVTTAFPLVSTDRIDADNIRLNGNTISSSNANGDLSITPDGTGKIVLAKTQQNAAVYGPAVTYGSGFSSARLVKTILGDDSVPSADLTFTIEFTNTGGVYSTAQIFLRCTHAGNGAPLEEAVYTIKVLQRLSALTISAPVKISGDDRPITTSSSGLTMTLTIEGEGSSVSSQGVIVEVLGGSYGIASIS